MPNRPPIRQNDGLLAYTMTAMDPLEGKKQVGRYEILSELGRGAMGAVYKARDPKLDRTVAVKTIISAMTGGSDDREEMLARFEREARVSAKLQNANVVAVYDVGVEGDEVYLVMELVDGETLQQRLARGEFPSMKQALEWVAQAADALAAAHEAGIIHRDIKPANLMLTKRGRIKIADFGVAKAVGEKMDLTRTGMMVGSPAYMAPEQVKGTPLDGRSDLFSLGVVLYEMVLRRKPFPADTVTTLVYQILHEDPMKDVPIPEQVSTDLADFIRWALAKDREMRIPDARTFADRARAMAAGQSISVPDSAGATSMMPAPAEVRTSVMNRPAGGAAGAPAQPQQTTEMLSTRPKTGLWIGIAAVVVLAAGLTAFLMKGKSGATEATADQGTKALEAQVVQQPEAPASQKPATSAAGQTELTISVPEVAQTPPESTGEGLSEAQPPAQAATPPTTSSPQVARTSNPAKAKSASAPARQEEAPAQQPTQQASAAAPQRPVFQVPPASQVKETYEARRAVQFTVRPTSAVIKINGVDIGTAGDWDSFLGAGRPYPIPTPGDYYVELSADGYKTLWIKISIREDAHDLTARIRTRLDKDKG